jgi:hypothetical protein
VQNNITSVPQERITFHRLRKTVLIVCFQRSGLNLQSRDIENGGSGLMAELSASRKLTSCYSEPLDLRRLMQDAGTEGCRGPMGGAGPWCTLGRGSSVRSRQVLYQGPVLTKQCPWLDYRGGLPAWSLDSLGCWQDGADLTQKAGLCSGRGFLCARFRRRSRAFHQVTRPVARTPASILNPVSDCFNSRSTMQRTATYHGICAESRATSALCRLQASRTRWLPVLQKEYPRG